MILQKGNTSQIHYSFTTTNEQISIPEQQINPT